MTRERVHQIWSRARARVEQPRVRRPASVLVGLVCVGLLLWVAPPDSVIDEMDHLNGGWIGVAIGLEVLSCLGYVVMFRCFFPEPPRGDSRRVAWMAMGAGAVLPGGNISSAAATGWLLRGHGIGSKRLLSRCAALLCLLTLFGFAVNGTAAALLLVGVPGGPHDLLHTGGPILVSLVVLGGAAFLLIAGRRLGGRAPLALRGVAAGLEGAWDAALRPHWRLIGGAAFLLLDMGALGAACAATGHPMGIPALIVGYCIGYLATAIPMPAGLGVLDSGLSAALILYGMAPAASVGAVLVYHAIAIWVPGTGGLLAWLRLRGRREVSADISASGEVSAAAPAAVAP